MQLLDRGGTGSAWFTVASGALASESNVGTNIVAEQGLTEVHTSSVHFTALHTESKQIVGASDMPRAFSYSSKLGVNKALWSPANAGVLCWDS
eukprot:5990594-Amphidinium_carterae.1